MTIYADANDVIKIACCTPPSPDACNKYRNCAALSGIIDPSGAVLPNFIGQLYTNTVTGIDWKSNGVTLASWTLAVCAECPTCPPVVVCSFQEGADSPVGVVVPGFIGQLYHQTGDDTYWRSTGLTNADWTLISGGGGSGVVILTTTTSQIVVDVNDTDASFSAPNLTTGGILQLTQWAFLTSISAPFITVIEALYLYLNPVLVVIPLPSIITINSDINTSSNAALTTIDWSGMVTCNDGINGNDCPLLTSVLVPVWLPTDETLINFNNCALSITSMELIIARLTAAAVTMCDINLAGGTNAGLSTLSGAAQAQWAALVTAGNTTAVNP